MSRLRQSGLSLVELMIAMAIGLILMAGVTLVISSSMNSRNEMDKLNRQIENGRYGIETLADDIRHAGLYDIYQAPASTAALPDPCSTVTATVSASLPWVIQGYHQYDPAGGTLSCLPTGMVQPGSDVLVIRRMGTVAAATLAATTLYIQPGLTGGTTNEIDKKVDTGANSATFTLKKKDTGTGGATQDTYTSAASIYPMVVHIYFISPCSYGTGTAGACTANDDTIPTLKRLELGAGPAFGAPQAIAEGVERLHLEYGIDSDKDGTADGAFRQCVDATECTAANWQDAVAVNVYLLARNPEKSSNYSDGKTYQMGALSITPSGADLAYKRHVFESFVRVRNLSMARECSPSASSTCP